MNIRLKAKGSGKDPYDVDFCVTDDGNVLTVFCTCQAGSFGKNCKHKNELIAGDV